MALVKKDQKERRNSKKISSTKRTHQIKSAILFPNFAARYCLIRKYFGGQQPRKQRKKKATIVRKHHTTIPRNRNTRQVQKNQIKLFIISRLPSTKQHQRRTFTNLRQQHENITKTKF